MKATVKTAILAASVALIGSVGAVSSGWAQQQPGATPAPQATTPTQPGPGMGQQMMQQGMEHGKDGQSMSKQMEEKGHQQGGQHAPMGSGTTPQPSQGTSPAPSK
jgi:hypothetical protein